jgi:phage shock protein PspC (stress-responsive transcriptional regulator)
MKLTHSQNRRVQRYVREVGRQLGALSDEARERQLALLRERIDERLRALHEAEPDDEQVETVLQRCGAPETVAKRLVKQARDDAEQPRGTDRVWLGVCLAASRQFGFEVRYVRVGAVLLGLVLPLLPFVLLAYLGCYAVLHYAGELPEAKPVDWWGFAKVVGGVFAGILALHLLGILALEGVQRLVFRFLQTQPQLPGEWAWLAWRGGSLFLWAMLITLPLAALSALPVPPLWRGTLRKVAYATVALYAVALCFGVACYLVGTAVALAADFEGIPAVTNLF